MTGGLPKRILIIDDDIDFVDLICAAIKDAGCDIVRCTSGEEGLEKAKEIKPDLIVLDMFMPGIHGLQALGTLRTDIATSEIPVLINTNMKDQDIEVQAAALGAEFVNKRDTVAVVAARIKRILGIQ